MIPKYQTLQISDSSAEATVMTAVAGHYLHINTLIIANVEGQTQTVTIKDGDSGSTILIAAFADSAITTLSFTFPGSGLRVSAGKNLRAASSASTNLLQITAVGYVDRI